MKLWKVGVRYLSNGTVGRYLMLRWFVVTARTEDGAKRRCIGDVVLDVWEQHGARVDFVSSTAEEIQRGVFCYLATSATPTEDERKIIQAWRAPAVAPRPRRR